MEFKELIKLALCNACVQQPLLANASGQRASPLSGTHHPKQMCQIFEEDTHVRSRLGPHKSLVHV